MGRVISTISGGKASAYCADWALRNYNKDDVILYFNDTKWEHEDLYRFLDDLSKVLNKEILYDSDGRSVEELFKDENAIANNRMPFCSRILKAERLRKFIQDGDIIIFGIDSKESHRAERILQVYEKLQSQKKIKISIRFPLIEENVSKEEVDLFLKENNIKEPHLYTLGFSHNNCSGGCVRAGKKQWKLLYEKLPNVYADRERVEKELQQQTKKDITILKDESLEHFRGRIESGNLSAHYADKDEDGTVDECVGVCNTIN